MTREAVVDFGGGGEAPGFFGARSGSILKSRTRGLSLLSPSTSAVSHSSSASTSRVTSP